MRMARVLFALVLLPGAVFAHSLKQNERIPGVGVNDKGELIYQQDDFSYKGWNSAQLAGKVRVIQHIAGRSSAKEKNALSLRQSRPHSSPTIAIRPPLSLTLTMRFPAPACLYAAALRAIKNSIPGRSLLSIARAM